MEKVIEVLSGQGPYAIISGLMLYLFLYMWKQYQIVFQQQHDTEIDNMKAMGKLTDAMEDVAISVDAVGEKMSNDVGSCKKSSYKMIEKLDMYLHERMIEQARAEERREITGRIKLPLGEE